MTAPSPARSSVRSTSSLSLHSLLSLVRLLCLCALLAAVGVGAQSSSFRALNAFIPGGCAVDGAGFVYASDTVTKTVVKLSPAGDEAQRFVATPALLGPVGVAVDSTGAVYVADSNNNRQSGPFRVLKWAANGTQVGSYSLFITYGPTGVAISAQGLVYVGIGYPKSVVVLTSNLALVTTLPIADTSGYSSVDGAVAVDVTGAVYFVSIAPSQAGSIFKLAANGTLLRTFSAPAPTSYGPNGIAVDAAGAMYISGQFYLGPSTSNVVTNGVFKLAPNGSAIAFFSASSPAFNNPTLLATDTTGGLYVTDTENNRVVKLSTSTGSQLAQYTDGKAAFNEPVGAAIDGDGNIFVASLGNRGIVKMTSGGAQLWALYNYSAAYLGGLAVDSAGNVYAASFPDQASITKISPSGVPLQVFTTSNPVLYQPTGVALDAAQNLIVA